MSGVGMAGRDRAEAANGEADNRDAVAELPGLHGAFSFPERLLQQIWLRGDFDRRALRLRDGRALRLWRRGRWNRLAGPDFSDAEIEIGEGPACETVRGAVEVHLRATDWDAHGHAADPAYDHVCLHVVLFPSMREWTRGAGGRNIPILELLPLLERDLEAYAEEAAVEGIAGRPFSQLREALIAVPPERLREEVERQAQRRWRAKVALAASRIGRLGWEEACHHAALEVLGYRPNRMPMLAVAEAFPLATWRARGVVATATTGETAKREAETATEAWLDELTAVANDWIRAGVRPANQPRRRLAQYSAWVVARPAWPENLADWTPRLVRAVSELAEAGDTRPPRGWVARLRARWAPAVCGDALGGSRLDTLICDAWLPLLAARAVEEAGGVAGGGGVAPATACERVWRVWTPGDAPEELVKLGREQLGAERPGAPLLQGELQGLLGWLAGLAEGGKSG